MECGNDGEGETSVRTLITGAGGFVGRGLLRRLAESRRSGDVIIATDLAFEETVPASGIHYRAGSIADPAHLQSLLSEPVDRVFHFATVAGVQQSDFALGKSVNLDATIALLDLLSLQEVPARLIYSSSVGVFGRPFPAVVDDDTLPAPPWSYGTHKLVCEYLITDYARAGRVDGLALRFPGIVARPEGSQTMLSAFINNLFYAARDRRDFMLPLGAEDGTWLMSLRRCLDNVSLAAELDGATLPARRAWTLPALFVTMRELVDALAETYGTRVRDCISFAPVEAVQQLFATVPLRAPGAEALGLRSDATALDLVRNVVAENPALAPRRGAGGQGADR